MTAKERFWAKVQKTDGCWIWTGALRHGRPAFSMWPKVVTGYRFVWELTYGPIPDGLHVCHHCDNPACVRPDHLFVGTAADNLRDMGRKGRSAPQTKPHLFRGENNGHSKLTREQVEEIRATITGPRGSLTRVARKYGISVFHASDIRRGKFWRQELQ